LIIGILLHPIGAISARCSWGDAVVTWPKIEAGRAGLTLKMAENRRSIGKLAEWRDAEWLCCGHGAPLQEGAAKVLARLRDEKS